MIIRRFYRLLYGEKRMTISTIKSDEARNRWAALLDRVVGNQSEEVEYEVVTERRVIKILNVA